MRSQIEKNALQDFGTERIEHENDEWIRGKGKLGGILNENFNVPHLQFRKICSRD